jgi:hypothetical protein
MSSGFVTLGAEADACIMRVAEQTQHRNLDVLQVYSRRAKLLADHSPSSFV